MVTGNWFRNAYPQNQEHEPNVTMTFKVKGKGHCANVLISLSCKELTMDC